ncbi:STAS domain-containing protein [Actinophytocola sp.]|jgi:anti-anti-sigma factor|uniref:STAS domain-containing protein n=1 Tax=Actinophytocola sp. TaxID=1872138 RepID=UPI002ED94DB3
MRDRATHHGRTRPDRAEVGELLVVRRERHGPDLTVIRASGEVDLLTAPLLRDELASHAPAMVLDLTQVEFLAAVGLAELLAAADAARADGRRFGVVGARGATRRALDVSGVAELVPCYPTLADAIRDLVEASA